MILFYETCILVNVYIHTFMHTNVFIGTHHPMHFLRCIENTMKDPGIVTRRGNNV